MGDSNAVLTTAKAAQLLGVSTRTVQLWVESGQLPSWKTPGGHRRIPRQAVLSLIENPIQEHVHLRAHAIVVAGKGRGSQWRQTGLPGSGLLLDVTEDVPIAREWLAMAPPMVVVVEDADQPERKSLTASLAHDPRFRQTVLVSMTAKGEVATAAGRPRHLHLKMAADVASASAAVIASLQQTDSETRAAVSYRLPWNESARLEAVRRSGLLRSEPEEKFDRLVRLAAHATHSPIAMFTLIAQEEQWFKSRVGFDGVATPRDWAFCNETLFANEFTVIEDLSQVESFSDNPALAKPFGFRFYAGAPVRDPLGFALGSTCIIDVVPRTLSPQEREALTTVADATSNLIWLREIERRFGSHDELTVAAS